MPISQVSTCASMSLQNVELLAQSFRHDPDCLRIRLALSLEAAGCECVRRVVRQHRYTLLDHDGPLVVLVGGQVHGAAGFRLARSNDCLVDMMAIHPLAAVVRKQGGMDV